MGKRKRLLSMIEREREFYDQCQVGSEEYVASQNRLKDLEKQLAELGDQSSRTAVEAAKIVAYVATSAFTLGKILAFEKNDSFSTIAKTWLSPKKL